jgi:hypothetical protein
VQEPIEITQGWTPWFETGFYLFTSIQPGGGWEWVGDHIRPRIRAPESWHLPVGLSLSTEIGYQQRSLPLFDLGALLGPDARSRQLVTQAHHCSRRRTGHRVGQERGQSRGTHLAGLARLSGG